MTTLTKMNALTRINANTKVKYDVMNALESEIEARDEILDDKINVLKATSLVVKAIPSGVTKIADITECGIYSIQNGSTQFTDYPSKLTNTGLLYGELVVSKNPYLSYELTVINGNYGNATKMYGIKNNNTNLIDWQQITTITKTLFSCTANTGVTISQQDCYILNGEFIATLTVSITDGTSFSQNIVATLPFTPKSIYVGNAMGRTDLTTSAWLKKVNCYCDTGKNIAVTTEDATIKQVLLTIKGGVA